MSKRKIIVDFDVLRSAFGSSTKRKRFLNDLSTYNDALNESSDESDESPSGETESIGSPRKSKLSPYNKFMKSELPKFRESNPDIDHRDAFRAVAEMWKESSSNPKNINRSVLSD